MSKRSHLEWLSYCNATIGQNGFNAKDGFEMAFNNELELESPSHRQPQVGHSRPCILDFNNN